MATWLYVLEKAEGVLSLPFLLPGFLFGQLPDAPDATTIGGISLLFGAAYYVTAGALDRSGRQGAATPFVVAQTAALAVAVFSLAGDLEETGTGALLVGIGSALLVLGVAGGRRFTAWLGGVALVGGAALLLARAFEDDATAFGVAAIAAGCATVAVAHWLASATGEPGEMEPGPSPLPGDPAVGTGVAAVAVDTGPSPWAPPPASPPYGGPPPSADPRPPDVSPWARPPEDDE